MIRQFRIHQLRHARVVIKMPLRQRYINVARFPDGFAIVQRFQHGKQAGVFLQQPRQRIQMPRPSMPAQLFPFRLGLARGGYGGIYIGLCGLCQRGQRFARRRVPRHEPIPRFGKCPINEMAKTVALIHQPCQCLGGGFGGWAIIHAVEYLFYGHFILPQILKFQTQPQAA